MHGQNHIKFVSSCLGKRKVKAKISYSGYS